MMMVQVNCLSPPKISRRSQARFHTNSLAASAIAFPGSTHRRKSADYADYTDFKALEQFICGIGILPLYRHGRILTPAWRDARGTPLCHTKRLTATKIWPIVSTPPRGNF